jgi:hypothetical protein
LETIGVERVKQAKRRVRRRWKGDMAVWRRENDGVLCEEEGALWTFDKGGRGFRLPEGTMPCDLAGYGCWFRE